MAENFQKLVYELKMAEGITGFTTLLDTGKPGPTILILGDLCCVIPVIHPTATIDLN